jgi:hypothetical protein
MNSKSMPTCKEVRKPNRIVRVTEGDLETPRRDDELMLFLDFVFVRDTVEVAGFVLRNQSPQNSNSGVTSTVCSYLHDLLQNHDRVHCKVVSTLLLKARIIQKETAIAHVKRG